MRILYCNKYNFAFSGTETYLFEAMGLMRSRGHEAALFSMADPRGEATAHDRHFVPLVDFKNSSAGWSGQAKLAASAIYSREARRRLRKMIVEFRPDVAHVRNIYHHLTPSILWELKKQKIPILYHLNDFKLLCPSYNMVSKGQACERCREQKFWHVVTEGCYTGPRGSTFVLAAEAYLHKWLGTYEKCVNCFLAPSLFVRDKLIENGWNAEKIKVLPHFQRLPTKISAPPQRNAPILYFGRLSPEKGVDDLLQAMRLVPEVRLQIAGDGPQRRELENLAKDLCLRNIEFIGYLQGEELNRRIAAAQFTVLPSRAYETLGKSILESYAWARPVVASDLGSRREVVSEGKTGLLYPPGVTDHLAEAISFLNANPDKAMEMGVAGREFVREHHSPDAHYAALMQLYEELTGQTSKSAHAITILPPKRKLRIAFIGGRGVISKYSGIETYYEQAGSRLADMGHEVTVYCRTYFTPPLDKYMGMRVVRLPTIRSKHLETLVHTLLSTVHVLFQPCDVVHYHALGPALFSFVPRLLGKRTVVTVQGLDWRRKKWGQIAARVLRWGEQASIRMPNTTMVVSQTLQQYYHDKYEVMPAYVPNGTTVHRRRKFSHPGKWGLEAGNYILFLGRFSPEKNCHLLIEAYQRIETPVKLVLAGGMSYADRYASQLRGHSNGNIYSLGWVGGRDLEELLTNAMLFVLPSEIEGLSLALLEAMGSGVCVLASDIPENREVVQDAGFTFKHGNVDDLERMLRLLISHRELRQAAARAGQKIIRERYLWSHAVKQIDWIYQDLTAANGMPMSAGAGIPAKSKSDTSKLVA